MFYIVSKYDLEDLKAGKKTVEEVAIVDNEALVYWSGEEVARKLDEYGIEQSLLQYVINEIKRELRIYDCDNCIENVLDIIARKIKEVKQAAN